MKQQFEHMEEHTETRAHTAYSQPQTYADVPPARRIIELGVLGAFAAVLAAVTLYALAEWVSTGAGFFTGGGFLALMPGSLAGLLGWRVWFAANHAEKIQIDSDLGGWEADSSGAYSYSYTNHPLSFWQLED